MHRMPWSRSCARKKCSKRELCLARARFGLNPYFETNGNGTLCRERNCRWPRRDEWDGIRKNSAGWLSSGSMWSLSYRCGNGHGHGSVTPVYQEKGDTTAAASATTIVAEGLVPAVLVPSNIGPLGERAERSQASASCGSA